MKEIYEKYLGEIDNKEESYLMKMIDPMKNVRKILGKGIQSPDRQPNRIVERELGEIILDPAYLSPQVSI